MKPSVVAEADRRSFLCRLAGVLALGGLSTRGRFVSAAGAESGEVPPPMDPEPIPVVVLRLTHSHVHWLLGWARDHRALRIVGVYEPNAELGRRLLEQYGMDVALLSADLEGLLAKGQARAALLYGSVAEHEPHGLAALAAGLHVMVEKPLALDAAAGQRLARAAEQALLQLLTNYETTWYASAAEARDWIASQESFGPIRRIVANAGHPGPIEIGCPPEFLEWLTDPRRNGAGALTDFGCYGALWSTWLLDGRKPLAVTAVAHTTKPELYPDVDDDATLLLDYGDCTCVVQASWSWPIHRKDLAVHGTGALVRTIDGRRWEHQVTDDPEPTERRAADLPVTDTVPFEHFAAVLRGEREPHPQLTPAFNLTVLEILDAARRSASSGRREALGDGSDAASR